MAKAKPAKTVRKTKKATPAPVLPSSVDRHLGMARKSMKVSVLLFAFVLLLTIGALLFQATSKNSFDPKNTQASTFKENVGDFLDVDQKARRDKNFGFAISYLAGKGILLGYEDNTLRPDNPVNRAEFLKMLTIALKADTKGFGKPCFTDIKGDEWFAPYVCFAKDAGWISGYDGGKALPGNQISIAEALKIIVTAEKWDLKDAQDYPVPKAWKVADNAWYVPYIKVAYKKLLLYNYRFAENLDPASLLSRKDVIVILFSGILVDTIKVDKYDPKHIPQLFKQAGIALPAVPPTGEAPPTPSPEPPPKK